jgi:CubicO group peptidase (beta-lactamase class C family)
MSTYFIFGLCPEGDTASCAKYAHDHLFVASPGEKFTYSETSFFVLGAIAMKVTGLSNFDSVFQEMIARPLGMSCDFAGAALSKSSIKTDPGAGLVCMLMNTGNSCA